MLSSEPDTFPAALRLTAEPASSGRDTGRVLALNTLGGIAGTLLAGFVLVPRLGLERSLALMSAVAAPQSLTELTDAVARATSLAETGANRTDKALSCALRGILDGRPDEIALARDAAFMHLAALYAGHTDFDLPQLVAELVTSEAVPALPAQRYTDTGLRKRQQWQATWDLQRREDAIDAEIDQAEQVRRQELMDIVTQQAAEQGKQPDADALAWVQETLNKEFVPLRKERKAQEVGPIPVPPKYQSKDFLKADVWRLRGGLDVPKERWVSYPGCERGADGSMVIAWAGWNHLQQATAVAAYYLDMKDSEGWEPARLQPLLASLLELVPWLEQWHNDLDPVFGERMGDYYRSFVTEEARALGFTLEDLQGWKPAAVPARRGRRRTVS